MNFLAPWFLVGAVAVAGPILFHLIRRSVRERLPFSSALFLRPTPPKATRRRKLEHLLLLCLRCLALVLLAAGFARPFFPKTAVLPPPEGAGRQTILLLDLSASMRREGLWLQARSLAAKYIEAASLADRVSLVTFDRQPRKVFSLADWSAWSPDRRAGLARERLDALSPGWAGTHLGLALTSAAEQFADEPGRGSVSGQREVILISDLQEGGSLDGLQGHDWPKGVRVILEKVTPKHVGNAGLQILEPSLAGGPEGQKPRVRIVNSRDSAAERFVLAWSSLPSSDFLLKRTEVYLPAGQARVFPAPELPAGVATGVLRLTGDEETFDNDAWFVAPEKEHLSIAYLGVDPPTDPERLRYYLDRAFPETPRRVVAVVGLSSNATLTAEWLNQASLAVVPGDLSPDQTRTVRAWLEGGKTALLVLSNTLCAATLGVLAGSADAELQEISGDFALPGEIDFSHPLLAPFSDPRFSDFSHIHFWRHRSWTIPPSLNARVLIRFDDRSPALVQVPAGRGNLLVFAAGWHPADSQLALSSKFAPLLENVLEWSLGAASSRSFFQIGDLIPAPVATGAPLEWRRPGGKVVTLAAGAPFTDTDEPGFYTTVAGGRERRFAVNLAGEESRTAPLSPDEFARLGVPLGATAAEPTAKSPELRRRFQQEELEGRQKLWRWCLVAILAAAFLEAFLGGWFATRARTVEVTS